MIDLSKKIIGTYPTMITPYQKNGEVDYGAVKALTEWYYEKGCDGIFAVCQSSEIHFLSLNDRVKIAKTVKDTADALASQFNRPMGIVASGHISYDKNDQFFELNSMADTGIDSLILISNRMDIPNTNEENWIKDTELIMEKVNNNVPLGVYECPSPYKRLLTDKMLKFCAKSNRFAFMKDTCCDAEIIKRRVQILEGSYMKLLNANAQTLLDSLKSGGAGYCGIMANFHPELYVWLCNNFDKNPKLAEIVQSFLGTSAFTEQLAYPCTAKYHLKEIEKLPIETYFSRSRNEKELTPYNKDCIIQMETLANHIKNLIN